MTNLPPKISRTPIETPIADQRGDVASIWAQHFNLLLKRVGGVAGNPIIGDIKVYETEVSELDLLAAASKVLLDADAGEQWKIREIYLSGAGTNFSGGGGDRDLAITDGTSTWTVIPAATLQALAAGRWGDAGVPFPATAAHLTAASAAGTDIVAEYSGGTADYSAGTCTLILLAERVA